MTAQLSIDCDAHTDCVQCRRAVVVLLGLKRYNRAACMQVRGSMLLLLAHSSRAVFVQSNVKDVVQMIARMVWSTKVGGCCCCVLHVLNRGLQTQAVWALSEERPN